MKGSRRRGAKKKHNSTIPSCESQAQEVAEPSQSTKVVLAPLPRLDKVCPWSVTIKNTFLSAVVPVQSFRRISMSAPGRIFRSDAGRDFIDQEDNAVAQVFSASGSAHSQVGFAPTAVEDPTREPGEVSRKDVKLTPRSDSDGFNRTLKGDSECEHAALREDTTEGNPRLNLGDSPTGACTEKIDADQKATKKRRKKKSGKSPRPSRAPLETHRGSCGPQPAQRLGFAECSATVVSTTTRSAWPASRLRRGTARFAAQEETPLGQPGGAASLAMEPEEFSSAEFPRLFQRGPLPFDYIVRAAEVASHIATELTRQRAVRAERQRTMRCGPGTTYGSSRFRSRSSSTTSRST